MERLPSEEQEDNTLENQSSDEDQDDCEDQTRALTGSNKDPIPAARGWTARAGSYMAEKMAFFERLG